jgi:hypothetical protein
VDFFKRGIENLPKRWEAVVNNGREYTVDWLIISVKNKLFGSVKKPHELMHQPNNSTSLELLQLFLINFLLIILVQEANSFCCRYLATKGDGIHVECSSFLLWF